MNEITRAREIIKQEHGDSANWLTPTILGYGMIDKNTAYELSKGPGVFLTTMFSVSVVVYDPANGTTDRHTIDGECFTNRHDANEYIHKLKAASRGD